MCDCTHKLIFSTWILFHFILLLLFFLMNTIIIIIILGASMHITGTLKIFPRTLNLFAFYFKLDFKSSLHLQTNKKKSNCVFFILIWSRFFISQIFSCWLPHVSHPARINYMNVAAGGIYTFYFPLAETGTPTKLSILFTLSLTLCVCPLLAFSVFITQPQ